MSSNVHYINERERQGNGRKIASTINEAKEEFKQFAETRLAMLQAEMKEKIATLKASAPMFAIGIVIGFTSFLAFTGALISLLWLAFASSSFGPFISFLIVGVLYAIIGFGAVFMGYKNITEKGLVPNRTIKVLKEDKVWLQNEARTQL
jgi:uncharacterized membrane protein YqjE